MAKTCWFCDRKLNMLNIIPFDGKSICSDCSDLYDKMMFSQNKAEVEHSVEILLSMCEKGTEAYEYIIKYSQKCPSASSYEEESREEEARKQREEQEAREKECEKARIEALEQQAQKDLFLKSNSHEGYYEYKVVSICDDRSGSVDVNYLTETMNELGREGWYLRCAFANELGHNSKSDFLGSVTNATIDDNILIFERFIKFKN